ncbi:glycolate oxidase subunit GlcE [Paracoccus saliphilus]|uniref:Glycolate oxidase FAD binding subunit n=1 Tax=Paracoccus saliphilus TaxID=405559 RepID=A0AA45W138_9RHOB|nr:glycolate oxidase subunit GlcE [Paracoccus saliphilus]WCR03456.1 glycolate oxidase subunit GlcE [Paracoccus saliphilus]SIS53953.1 glycolate oxidase FAD binding subunit [Paracoccus saliphilus]
MTSETISRTTNTPKTEAELAEIVAGHFAGCQPLRTMGGGTRVQADHIAGDTLTTRAMSGVVTYEPGEMTLIARAGTPLWEIEAMLVSEGQALAFEPPDLRGVLGSDGTPTIGGMVAANASGPRGIMAGACRDHLLGVRFVDGQGRVLKNGGRVMKNVTGLDLSKLLCGSFGTLGILTEVAMKTLPHAQARGTLAIRGVDDAEALRTFTTALATPFEISGAAFHDGTAWLRIEGLPPQLAYRQKRLQELFGAYEITFLDAEATVTLWRDLRDVAHFAGTDTPLWRVPVKPSDAPALTASLRALGGQTSLDWGGGLIWYCGPGEASAVRDIAPHAMLVRRGGVEGSAFPRQSAAVERLSQELRRKFDPAGILNPGLMGG